MDRGGTAGDRGAGRNSAHPASRQPARGTAVATPGTQGLLGRQCGVARRVGSTPRDRQRFCPPRGSGPRARGGHGHSNRATRLGGNAPHHRPRREPAAGPDFAVDGSGIPAEVIMPSRNLVPTRRELLRGSGALFAWALVPGKPRADGRDPRFLTIILRGAVDGLAVVAPVGDPDWSKLRGDKALALDGAAPALPLDGFFALNPSMANFHRLYRANQATIVHAA